MVAFVGDQDSPYYRNLGCLPRRTWVSTPSYIWNISNLWDYKGYIYIYGIIDHLHPVAYSRIDPDVIGCAGDLGRVCLFSRERAGQSEIGAFPSRKEQTKQYGSLANVEESNSGRWFGTFFIFAYIGNNHSN